MPRVRRVKQGRAARFSAAVRSSLLDAADSRGVVPPFWKSHLDFFRMFPTKKGLLFHTLAGQDHRFVVEARQTLEPFQQAITTLRFTWNHATILATNKNPKKVINEWSITCCLDYDCSEFRPQHMLDGTIRMSTGYTLCVELHNS